MSARISLLAGASLLVVTISGFPASVSAAPAAAAAKSTSYVNDLIAQADVILAATGKNRDMTHAVTLLTTASAAGNTGAMRKLAAILLKGDGVAADPARALTLINQAITAGDLRANEALADLYRAETPLKDSAKAIEAYQKAVDAGSTGAMRKLAAILLKGEEPILPNPARAAALIRQAITAGDVKGGNESLGDLYRAVTPLKDDAKAVEAYQLAADAGNTSAMRKLAAMLVAGDGVPAEPSRAEALLNQIIAAGDVRNGQEAFGDFYRAASAFQDATKAAAAYQMAADAGNVSAIRKLAGMLSKGDAIPGDPARAAALLKQAIDAGDSKVAPEQLADLYLTSRQPKDVARAIKSYEQAVAAGNTGAMRKLAAILLKGDGVAADPDRALTLVNQAIAAGDLRANEALADVYRAETPLKDGAKAIEAYQKAADAGSTGAMRKLASMLIKGEEAIPSDPPRAAALIRQAIAAGDLRGGNEALGDLYRAATPLNDNTKALKAYQFAADAGSTSAMRKLAVILVKGDGVPADPSRAEALLNQMIAAGDIRNGQEAFGDFYRAESPLKDPAKAADAYQKAADAGNASAMRKLAAMLAKGEGIPGDPARAETLLKQAIDAGETKWAPKDLGALVFSIAPDARRKEALGYFTIAAAQGNPDAHLAAAEILRTEPRTARSQTELVLHLRAAADVLGPLPVAKSMMKYPTTDLVYSVQLLLREAGYLAGADGVLGNRSKTAIAKFCTTQSVKSCPVDFVSMPLLEALLKS